MSRRRVAIARFAEKPAAERAHRALQERGGHPRPVSIDSSSHPEAYRLEVDLSASVERALLEVLLSSEATRVHVHDAECGEAE